MQTYMLTAYLRTYLKMSKILFIGDPHLRMNNFDQSIKFLRWVEEQVEILKPDIVCNLGDTFHNHAVLRSELLKEFRDHVLKCTHDNIPYWYVLGNHDQYKPKDSKYHALQLFEDIHMFTLFDKTTHLEEITVVPYVQEFKDFPTDTRPIVITHNTFIGADYGFKREDCGINADKIHADVIISGHIHKRQSFGKVHYPGTPFAHTATDVNQTKGLLLFDTKTYKQQFIESPFPQWKSVEFEVDQLSPTTALHLLLEQTLDSENKWILKVSGPKVELAAYFKSSKYLKLIEGKSVVSKTTPTDAEKQNRVKIEAVSPEGIVSEYVKKVYSGGEDKDSIIKRAHEIIKGIH